MVTEYLWPLSLPSNNPHVSLFISVLGFAIAKNRGKHSLGKETVLSGMEGSNTAFGGRGRAESVSAEAICGIDEAGLGGGTMADVGCGGKSRGPCPLVYGYPEGARDADWDPLRASDSPKSADVPACACRSPVSENIELSDGK